MKQDIVGLYRLPNANPESGQTVIIFENNTFATFFFGGALKGTWKMVSNQINFKTDANPKFYLYGRNLSALKDSTQLNFSCEENALVNLNTKTSNTFQPLFNKDANCFNYPYIHKTNTPLGYLAVAKQEHSANDSFDIYNYEIDEKYNDLMVIGLSDQYTTAIEFSAIYKAGNLYFGSDKAASKKPLSMEDSVEDKAYMDHFMATALIPEILIYGNEFFPNYDNPTPAELAPFTRIEPIKKEKGKVTIGKDNLFTATCN